MENNPSLLIVDDDQDICFVLQEIFQSFNISSYIAHSLNEAKTLIEQTNPTHLILDHHLPDGYGKSFSKNLSILYPDIKIVLLTGDSEITREGFDEILKIIQKPFTKNKIKEAFEDLINQ